MITYDEDDRKRAAMKKVVEIVRSATTSNWTPRYALEACRSHFNGLTDEADLSSARRCMAEIGKWPWYGSHTKRRRGCRARTRRLPCKDETVARTAETLVLQFALDYGGKATATELEKRFDQHKQLRSSGVGFPGVIHFYCMYCEQRGDPHQKAQMTKHIERCSSHCNYNV